jgi:uncharacterized protein YcbX
MASLAAIYRHPVKSLGEEALRYVTLAVGEGLPWDRVWAVAHDHSAFNPAEPEWATSRNFVIQSTNPALAQITCAFDEASGALTLTHPALGTITTKPGEGGAALTEWIAPIADAAGAGTPGPYRLAHVAGRALHDFPDTDISIGNLASLRALEEMAGTVLAHIRFRMNLWVDGFDPWEEFEWEGREVGIGSTRLTVIGRVKRCNATNADPDTGTRTTDLPRLLHSQFGHMDFGVYARVMNGGGIACGDEVTA